jgi:hypothetical protein
LDRVQIGEFSPIWINSSVQQGGFTQELEMKKQILVAIVATCLSIAVAYAGGGYQPPPQQPPAQNSTTQSSDSSSSSSSAAAASAASAAEGTGIGVSIAKGGAGGIGKGGNATSTSRGGEGGSGGQGGAGGVGQGGAGGVGQGGAGGNSTSSNANANNNTTGDSTSQVSGSGNSRVDTKVSTINNSRNVSAVFPGAPTMIPGSIVAGPGNRVITACGPLFELVPGKMNYTRNGKKTFQLEGQNTKEVSFWTSANIPAGKENEFFVLPDGSVFMRIELPDGSSYLGGHIFDGLVLQVGLTASSSWSIGGMGTGGGGSVGGGTSQSLSGAQVANASRIPCAFTQPTIPSKPAVEDKPPVVVQPAPAQVAPAAVVSKPEAPKAKKTSAKKAAEPAKSQECDCNKPVWARGVLSSRPSPLGPVK